MATKSKSSRVRTPHASDKTATQHTNPPQAQGRIAPPTESSKPDQQPSPAAPKATISKGIYLSALVYIEGDMAPADDFATPAIAALKSALHDALNGEHNGLTMTLKQVEVRNDVEQDDGAGGDATGGKFQF